MRYNEILYANFHPKAMLDAHEVFANQYEPITLVYSTNQLDRTVNIIGHSKPDPTITMKELLLDDMDQT